MNKNFKIFQIQGLTGLFLLGFVMTGLFCGFVLFPVWIIMTGWNEFVVHINKIPAINYYQAILLWLFTALCFYLILRNSISVKIHNTNNLDPDEINRLIEKDLLEDEVRENNK